MEKKNFRVVLRDRRTGKDGKMKNPGYWFGITYQQAQAIAWGLTLATNLKHPKVWIYEFTAESCPKGYPKDEDLKLVNVIG